MNKIKSILAAALVLVGLVGIPVMVPQTVAAADSDAKKQLCDGIGGCNNAGNASFNTLIKNIVNILLYILGAVAVIMIVIGGIRYTTSNGDQGSVKSAKDTILYAIIGLVVAFMAYAIVNWIIKML